jgi:hypothetical protein
MWLGILFPRHGKSKMKLSLIVGVCCLAMAACSGASDPNGLMMPPGPEGPQGIQGVPGKNGLNGEAGAPGKNGLSGEAGAPGKNGLNGEAGARGLPGLNGEAGAMGLPGEAGTNGLNSLIAEVPEADGPNCTYGGVKIYSGLDANNNGILDWWEIQFTQYVCNGPPGASASVDAGNEAAVNLEASVEAAVNVEASVDDTGATE